MALDLTLVALGAALLAWAGDVLVDSSAALARRLRLTPAVVGLTVVAAGTSTPELFVSTTAALHGSPDIALANVVGSNIANVGLILGLCALIAPIPIAAPLFRAEFPVMMAASLALLGVAWSGGIGRGIGAAFLVALLAFLVWSVGMARRDAEAGHAVSLHEAVERLARQPLVRLLLVIVACFLGLGFGARLLVDGAVGIARAAGVSERVIGLTLVAVGTSLPELVATAAAALKRHHEMAVMNILGSNIFNVLGILGVTALIHPLSVAPGILWPDVPAMLLLAALLYPLARWDGWLSRPDGALLLSLYWCYVGWVVFQGG
jgi:cation:H+ antiporter